MDALQEAYLKQMQPMVQKLQSTLGNDHAQWASSEELPASLRAHLLSGCRRPAGARPSTPRWRAYRQENRRTVDQLKRAIKHFSPAIVLETSYEVIAAALCGVPEVAAVADEDIRRYYFDKYIRHLRKRAGLEVGQSDGD